MDTLGVEEFAREVIFSGEFQPERSPLQPIISTELPPTSHSTFPSRSAIPDSNPVFVWSGHSGSRAHRHSAVAAA